MNSKHSFAQTNTNTLLKQTFIEFSSITNRPMQLMATPNNFKIKEHGKKDISFSSEEEVVSFLKREIREFKGM